MHLGAGDPGPARDDRMVITAEHGRGFVRKDGYSFHAERDDTVREYHVKRDANSRFFGRCGLYLCAVEDWRGE